MSLQAKLRSLFLLDQQLRGLRSRLDAATARSRAQQTKLERLAQQRREIADQHKQVLDGPWAAGFSIATASGGRWRGEVVEASVAGQPIPMLSIRTFVA